MRIASVAVWSLVAAGIAACAPAEPVVPAPRAVTPPWGFNGEDTPVVIAGDAFWPSLDVGVGRAGSGVDAAFAVELVSGTERTPLATVTWQDVGTLVATVPAGLPVGTFDVAVRAPSGATGVLPSAFAVRDTRVDRVLLDADAVVYDVRTRATARLSLADPSGRPVAEDLVVDIALATPDGSEAPVTWETSGLLDVVPRDGGLRARLGDDGRGELRVLGLSPGAVAVTVAPQDPEGRVRGDDLLIEWTRTDALRAVVSLPEPDLVVVAGTSFDAVVRLTDEFGNPADDVAAGVAITTACGAWSAFVQVDGPTAFTVTPTRADGCAEDRLVVTGPAQGQSDAFTVVAGQAARLDVAVGPDVVVAGGILNTLVTPRDAWGNLASWSADVVSVRDAGAPPESVGCRLAGAPSVYCEVRLTVAGGGRTLAVESAEGLEGASAPYAVTEGPASRLIVSAPRAWQAGVPVEVAVDAVDAWGNAAVPPDAAITSVGDADGLTACTPSGASRWQCRRDVASPSVALEARATQAGGAAVAGDVVVRVDNGPLAAIDVLPDALTVVAGVPLGLALVGLDAFGNPWRVQDAPASVVVRVGDVAYGAVVLDAAGEASSSVVIDTAGVVRVTASVDGVVRGTSPPVSVVPAAAASLRVSTARPWVQAAVPAVVRVDALDGFGNRADLSATVSVTSARDALVPFDVALVNGTGSATTTWATRFGLDTLRVAGAGGLTGTADVLVYRECADGPEVALEIEGDVPGDAVPRSCLVDGAASATVDLGGARAAPGRALAGVAAAVDGGTGGVGVGMRVAIGRTAPGIVTVRGFAVQDDGCGTAQATPWYVASAPGLPAGPVAVTPAAPSVDLEQADPTVPIAISGVADCRGVPVSGAPLRITTSRGTLPDALPSGAGRVVVVGASGTASATLDVGNALHGGVARLVVSDTAAVGEAVVSVTGDLAAPEVRAQSPKGAFDDVVTEVTLAFSEPMDPASLAPSVFSLTGPVVAQVVVVAPVDPAGTTWRLGLDPPITPGLGLWRLRVAPTAADLAGNPLAGTWDQPGAAYIGAFGGEASVDPVDTCVAVPSRFRPDGDPGAGEEADATEVAFTADRAPAWWVVTVRDAGGRAVRQSWVVPEGPSDAWAWDGRGDDGAVVTAGAYTVSVDAEGNEGTLGGACATTVTVQP